VRILVTLNISNPSNVGADSGYIFVKAVLETVLELRPDWSALVAGPREARFDHERIRTIDTPRILTKYEARFGFDWRHMTSALAARTGPIDLVWANQAELLGSMVALVRQLEGVTVPGFAYFHYPVVTGCDDSGPVYDASLDDWGLGSLVLLRQYEALASCTVAAIGSRFARQLLLEAFQRFGLPHQAAELVVLPPPIDFPIATDVGVAPPEQPTILYNHRLYGHYGSEQLVDWMAEFAQHSRRRFTLLVIDSLGDRTPEQHRLDGSVANTLARLARIPFARVVRPQTRSDYLACVREATVGLAPFRRAPAWSMSCADVMACGRPLLAPHSGPFPELLGDRPSLLFRDRTDFFDKLGRLVASAQDWRAEAEYCLLRSTALDRFIVAERFARLFEQAVRARVS
jgi:glycosyltransferase involved in cell wall biosynthesis